MRIDLDHDGGVLIEFESVAEAEDFRIDLDAATLEPGEDVCSNLINGDGVHTLTVRCLP